MWIGSYEKLVIFAWVGYGRVDEFKQKLAEDLLEIERWLTYWFKFCIHSNWLKDTELLRSSIVLFFVDLFQVPTVDYFTDRSWDNHGQLAYSELSRRHLNRSDLDLFVVVHLPLLLSKGIFGYDRGETKEGDEWSGRHIWDEYKAMKMECSRKRLCSISSL